MLAGIFLSTFAAKRFLENYRFKNCAVVLAGEVISSSKLAQPERTGTPLVKYVTPLGETREQTFCGSLAGHEFWSGEKVEVLYDPQSGVTKLDDWNELYLLSALLGFVAFLILLPPLVAGVIYLSVYWQNKSVTLALRVKK